jgi:LCP family protein required for cell wall assembly
MKDKSVLNILLIGTDTRQMDGPGRSDAIVLVSINRKTQKIIATSLLRDIYLRIPGKGSNRINAAYAYGGADLLMQTIENNFKIKIDRYASIDFFAFMEVVDAVGGVTLEVTKEEIPVINNYVKELNELTNQSENKGCLTEAGTLLLNGKQALGYARDRYIGYADFERTARQRRILEQLYSKVKDLGLIKLNKLLNIILPQITTNLTEGELFTLILSLPSYAKYDLEQWSVPIENTYTFLSIHRMSVLGMDFNKNIKEINKRIYNQQ